MRRPSCAPRVAPQAEGGVDVRGVQAADREPGPRPPPPLRRELQLLLRLPPSPRHRREPRAPLPGRKPPWQGAARSLPRHVTGRAPAPRGVRGRGRAAPLAAAGECRSVGEAVGKRWMRSPGGVGSWLSAGV